MIQEIFKILELREVKERKKSLLREEARLSVPLLTDTSLIPAIFEWFSEIHPSCYKPERRSSAASRQHFIFIILILYAPNALAGENLPAGIRNILASVLGFKSPTGVSNLYANAMFLYSQYKDYQETIDYLCTEIINRLKAKELIK